MQTLIKVAEVTRDRLLKYHTEPSHCDCPDYQNRGSYSSPDHRDCKHTIKLNSEIAYFRTRQLKNGALVCGCNEWQESDGEGLQGSCIHTKALHGWPRAQLPAAI